MKQNRKEILKTIFKLFLTRHYEDVSYDDMIKATNISKGGLYHYAPNKIELFRLVVDTFFLDLIKVEDDIMIKTSGSDKFALHDFLLSYASFLHKRFCRIQDFLQLPVDETARAFSFFILNSQRYHPSFYEKYLSLETREKELIKNVLLIAEKNGEIKNNMNLLLVSDMFYNSYSGLLFYSSFHPTDDFEKKLLMLFENVYSLIKVDS
ncbi:TetR/AcrR family transcriptional regulator [Bacteroides caccae]|jgi:AcrR family transcriptional regulator|uniref:TetR/AcrR family transcriptional regulator n=1 Tax=Bacteroides caccae TaxID=47678 RepID=UPI00189D5A60|nr:TetR/AcrR family transcriptional regulator [Bacteroides caccae]